MAKFRRSGSVPLKSWRARITIATSTLVLVFAGCATSSEQRSAPEAAPPAAAPAAAPPPPTTLAAPKSADKADDVDFATLEEAEAALERARVDLNRLALLEQPGGFAEAPAAAPSPAAPSRASRGASGANDEARPEKKVGRAREAKPAPHAESEAPAEGAASKGENTCDTGCKAFASLMRAKAAVCRLDSPGGSRCSRAEDIAREAEGRVRSCGCQQ